MPVIRCKTTLHTPDQTANIGAEPLITLPKSASAELPSRGMTMVEGTINGHKFRVVLQPDGQGSHWFTAGKKLRKVAHIDIGDAVTLAFEPTKVWPEPEVPADVRRALAADPQAHALWADISPMARWDWLNWIDIVKLYETRKQRPEKLCSMLKAGKRRPCCFNRAVRMAPKSAGLL